MPGVPMLGPVGAPQIAMPSVPGEIAQAIGSYPEAKQKYDYQQAEIDAQNMDNASKRLSVLTKIFSANQGIAEKNPQLVAATQRAFQQMGLSAPMKLVNGVQQLDTDALAAFGPAQDFIAQNMPAILGLPPDVRGDYIKAGTGVDPAPGIVASLEKLPQRTLTASDFPSLMSNVRYAIAAYARPGATFGGVVSMMRTTAQGLKQFGMTLNPDDFQADIYQTEYNRAMMEGLPAQQAAKAAQERSTADLNEARAAIQPELGQAAVESAGARQVSAQASASRAATAASEETALDRERNAQADHAEAQTEAVKQGVLTGTKPLSALVTQANQMQTLYSHLDYDQTQRQTALAALDPNDPDFKAKHQALNDEIYVLKHRKEAALRAAGAAQSAVQDAQKRLHAGSPTGGGKPDSQSGSQFVKGQVYDDGTHKARYMGGDPNSPSSWQIQP
jgi:hypothetical protein